MQSGVNPAQKEASLTTIPVVEDNPADARLLEEALREREVPVAVVVAENAVQAYEMLTCRGAWAGCPEPLAILLDLNLPIFSGFKALQIIRQHAPWKHIPVAVFTSSKSSGDREICAGPDQAADVRRLPRHRRTRTRAGHRYEAHDRHRLVIAQSATGSAE